MSLDRCILDLEAQGKLTPEQAASARDVYLRHQRRHRRALPRDAADALASEEAVASIERAARISKVQKLLQVRVQQRIIGDLASYRGTNRAHAAQALFDYDQLAPYMNVEALRKVIVGSAHSELTSILVRHRRNLAGQVRHVEELDDVVRELFGTKTGNLNAAEMAGAFRQVAEGLRQRFNAAGGAIGKLEGWGLPQRHNPGRVREAGFEAWRDFVAPRLDRARMIDDATGQPFDDESLAALLADVFATIRTEGWVDRVPSGGGGGSKLANRRAEHRVLHFADADSWIEYQGRFGEGGEGAAFDAMMAHVEGMARDIAHMEVLGPNPVATVRWLKDSLLREGALDPGSDVRLLDRYRSGAERIEQLYAATSGALNSPVSARWARRFGTVRALHTAQLLGSAFLSATTDVGFQAITRGFNGLPVTGALTGYLKLFRPNMPESHQVAVRLRLIAEEASSLGATQQRYLGESVGHEWSRRLADGVLRVSGLSPWTQAGRWAFGMEFLGTLADNFGKGFDDLPPPLRGALGRYGIDGAGWDVVRASTPYRHRGAAFADAAAIQDRSVADRLMAMILTETDYAVPTAGVRSQSLMTIGRPGTFWGEASRNTFLFKSFGVSLVLTHGARMMALRPANRALYAAGFTVTMTMLGALALQMTEIAKGRDPLPMVDAPEFNEDGAFRGGFWGRAVLKGGGFGIFGDLVAAGTSDRVGGWSEAIVGPATGMLGDAGRLATGQMGASDIARRYTPGGTIWYLRAAYERLVIDELKRQADPEYERAWRRVEQRLQDQGQDFYWSPGEPLPQGAPDLGAMFETPPPEASK
jgi:hypothetical protein